MGKKLFILFLSTVIIGCTDEPLFIENGDVTTRAMYLPWITGPTKPIIGTVTNYYLEGVPEYFYNTWTAPLGAEVISKTDKMISLKFIDTRENLLSANARGFDNTSYPTARLTIYPVKPKEPSTPGWIDGLANIPGHLNEVQYTLKDYPTNEASDFKWTLSDNSIFEISSSNKATVFLKRKAYEQGEITLAVSYKTKNFGIYKAEKNIKVLLPPIISKDEFREILFDMSTFTAKVNIKITVNNINQATVVRVPSRVPSPYFLQIKDIIYDGINLSFLGHYGSRRVPDDDKWVNFKFVIPAPN